MLQNSAEEAYIEEMPKGEKESFRMAKVQSLEGGRPMLRFFGEDVQSQKQYKYLQSYTPAVGDTVLLCRISGSLVILGKII